MRNCIERRTLQAFSAAAMIGKIEVIGMPIYPALDLKGHIRGRSAEPLAEFQ
jgi:hypothetical protein